MQQLLGDKLGSADANSFLRELFLQRLPSNVRTRTRSQHRSKSRNRSPTPTPVVQGNNNQHSLCWYHQTLGENARLFVVGKLQCWQLARHSLPALSLSQVAFFTSQTNARVRYLIDTGSEVSVLPPAAQDRRQPPHSLSLTAVNNTLSYLRLALVW